MSSLIEIKHHKLRKAVTVISVLVLWLPLLVLSIIMNTLNELHRAWDNSSVIYWIKEDMQLLHKRIHEAWIGEDEWRKRGG